MRIELFIKIWTQAEIELVNNSNELKINLSKNQKHKFSGVALHYKENDVKKIMQKLIELQLLGEDSIRLKAENDLLKLDPKLLNFQKVKQTEKIKATEQASYIHWMKEEMNEFIFQHNIIPLPEPARHLSDKSVKQRRLDSLSRLLSPVDAITPCIAVAIYEGQLIVSSNMPKKNKENFSEMITGKMEIIQNFLFKMSEKYKEDYNEGKIKFSRNDLFLAREAVRQLVLEKNGGSFAELPWKKKHGTVENHLLNALLKLSQYYLLSLSTKGMQGFSSEEASAFKADKFVIITPVDDVLKGQQLHAEQAIVIYLKQYTDFTSDINEKQLNIGISRLCCQACDSVLADQEKISYRGGHGTSFPNVFDISTGTLHKSIETQLGKDLFPDDSSSDNEMEDDSLEMLIEPERFTGTQAITFKQASPLIELERKIPSDSPHLIQAVFGEKDKTPRPHLPLLENTQSNNDIAKSEFLLEGGEGVKKSKLQTGNFFATLLKKKNISPLLSEEKETFSIGQSKDSIFGTNRSSTQGQQKPVTDNLHKTTNFDNK